ncbi:hypothetical protein E4T56_gene14500 [Termitomyces sp. T112]|nr:hypothetical protein E4T56_gene14500 [Termitomyces sp. T112]
MAGPSGPSSGADMMQPPAGVAPSMRSKSGICPGVVRLVPEGSRVVQAEVTLEQFAEAVGWARGPPTFEWCQAAAPCEFEAPTSGCSISLGWRAACVTAEQGWDQDWVAAQLEEGRKGRVLGRGSRAGEGEWVSAPVMKVGPPWGGRREGAPSMQEKGKWRASPSPEAGPSKRARGEQAMGGPPGSAVMVGCGGLSVVSGRELGMIVGRTQGGSSGGTGGEGQGSTGAGRGSEGTGLGTEGQGHCYGDCRRAIVPSAGVGGVDGAFAGMGGDGRGGDAAGRRLRGAGDSAGFQHWRSLGGGRNLGPARSASLGQGALHPS